MEIYNDGQTSHDTRDSFVEKVKELYKTGEISDVEFVLESTKLKAHRFVLSMASDVFRAMFYGSLSEKELVINIKDIPAEAFRNILQYIYTKEMSITSFTVSLATAYAAKKYILTPRLMDLCMQYAETYLDLNNIWEAFEAAVLFEHARLRRAVKFYIVANAKAVFSSEDFLRCPDYYMEFVISDVADYVSPVILLDALVSWAKEQTSSASSLRDVLEPFFPQIRFLAMSTEQFMFHAGRAGILSDEEFTTISLEIVRGRGSRRSPRWLNNQRTTTLTNLDYILELLAKSACESVAENVHLVFSFQVLNNGVVLKGVIGWARTTGDRLPATATLIYNNHTTNFSTRIECKIESLKELKKGFRDDDFRCLLPTPRILEENDDVTLSLYLKSEENTLTYSKGILRDKEYNLQSGKVIIQSHPVRECGLLSGVILTHVL